MQTLVVVLLGVFGTLVVLSIAGGLMWLYVDVRRRQKELVLALQEVAEKCSAIAAAPAYLEGMSKVAGDMVIQVTKLVAVVDKFHGSLFGAEKPRREEVDSWKPYDDTEADNAYEVGELVKAGLPMEEAMERVKAMAMARNVEEAERRARETFRLGR